jgi:N utilization substance protein A
MSLLYQTIDQLSREKGIDAQIIISAVEDAILVATRKYYKSVEDLQAHFNMDSGIVEVFAVKKVVEKVEDPTREMTVDEARKFNPEAAVETEIKIPKATDGLGRIAAQTAKQVIFQKVREAERDTVYAEYSQRVGELVNCTVKRLEGPDIIVDLGRTEARMPRKDQSRLENYQIGERLRAVITLVDRAARGPQVVVSRADAMLVQKLFQMEVPEIYDGTVVIRAMAREAGERTKVAVFSKDPDVDCVGACVGMKGMRVQSIIRELRGEKIDIIEYSEDTVTFAANALSPAKINHVSVVDIEQKHLEVIVDDSQLSLAIGKKGQNVRLAAKLLGWRIDIKSEEEKRQEIESQMAAMALRGAPVTELRGLGDKTMQRLRDHGIETVEQLAQMTPDELTQIQGIGEKTVDKIRKVVTDYFEADRQATEDLAAAEESAAAAESERLAAIGAADESVPTSGEDSSASENPGGDAAMVEETPTQEPVESAAGEHEESAGAEKKAEAEEMNATREEGETTEPATGGKE